METDTTHEYAFPLWAFPFSFCLECRGQKSKDCENGYISNVFEHLFQGNEFLKNYLVLIVFVLVLDILINISKIAKKLNSNEQRFHVYSIHIYFLT